MPEPNVNTSMYASWYRQTYPDKVLAISQTSNEGLVSVDNSGTVRLWETGVANLAQSMTEWKVGSKMYFVDRSLVLSVQFVVSISMQFKHFSVIISIHLRHLRHLCS